MKKRLNKLNQSINQSINQSEGRARLKANCSLFYHSSNKRGCECLIKNISQEGGMHA